MNTEQTSGLSKTNSHKSLVCQESWLLQRTLYEDFLVPHFLDFIESRYGFHIVIGIEIEFYLSSINSKNLELFLEDLESQGIHYQKEKGRWQYEIAIPHEKVSRRFLQQILKYKERLKYFAAKHGLDIIFEGKPYEYDYGSATHVHINPISLHEGVNLFSSNEIEQNKLMLNFIAGILKNTKASTMFLIGGSDDEYKRFQKGFLAPTHISWGGNNRTAVIRVPDSPRESRRLEFRLSSANSDIESILLFLLTSIIIGIEENLVPPPRLYGNAYDAQYSLEAIATSASEALKDNYFDKTIREVFFLTLL